jgi:hypothetical protein
MPFDQWIVVDDFETPTPCNLGQMVIRRQPFWKPGEMTLPLNILTALPWVRGEYILIVEDDDWYNPDYIRIMVDRLQNYDLVGGGIAHYYNVSTFRHIIHGNTLNASLCETGFRRSVMDSIESCIQSHINEMYVDGYIWDLPLNKLVFNDSVNCIGIKGMPGRGGLGHGHLIDFGYLDSTPFDTLQKWIGDDVKYYKDLR